MGFCIGAVFTKKNFGAYISYEFVVRLKSLAFLLHLIYDDVIVY